MKVPMYWSASLMEVKKDKNISLSNDELDDYICTWLQRKNMYLIIFKISQYHNQSDYRNQGEHEGGNDTIAEHTVN